MRLTAILGALLLALWSVPAHAQGGTGLTAACGTSNSNLATNAFVTGCNGSALATGAVIISSPTVDSTFCYKTAALGGNAFFTLTIPAASGFPAGCFIDIVNIDVFGAGGRGKTISGITLPVALAGGTIPNILWPGQSFKLEKINGAWTIVFPPLRVKLPNGSLQLFVNTSTGSNSNDGLATGVGNASLTTQACLNVVLAAFDMAAGFNGVTCNFVGTETTLIHYSPAGGGLPGNLGNQSIRIDGGGTGILSGAACVQVYNGAVLALFNLHLACSGNCIEAQFDGHVFIGNGVVADTCGSATLFVDHGGIIECGANTITWTANTPFFMEAAGRSLISCNNATVSLSNNVAVTATVACQFASLCQMPTWVLNAHTVTATNSYLCTLNAVIGTVATIPGTGAPSTGSGCQTF